MNTLATLRTPRRERAFVAEYKSPHDLRNRLALMFTDYASKTSLGSISAPGLLSYKRPDRLIDRWGLVSTFGRFMERELAGFQTDFCSNAWNKFFGLVWGAPELNACCIWHDAFYWYGRFYDVNDAEWWPQADRLLGEMFMDYGRQNEPWWKRPLYWARAKTHHFGPRMANRFIRWKWARDDAKGGQEDEED